MGAGNVKHVDRLPVVVEADRLGEGDLRKALRRVRLLRVVEGLDDLVAAHPHAAVLVRHDDGARATEVFVSVGVVVVIMRVDDELHGSVGDLGDRRLDLLRQRRQTGRR